MKKQWFRVMISIILMLCLVNISSYAYTYTGTTVCSHRGDSAHCPENTIAAFEAARLAGTQWIETDIHMTKDGVIVLTHDNNLNRVSGQNLTVSGSTLNQIKKLDIGSYYNEKYAGEHIATLEELLKWAGNYPEIKLIIEIKDSDNIIKLMKCCTDTIYKYDMQSRCALATNSYSVVQSIKNYASNIKCIYIRQAGLSDSDYIYYADAISVPYDTITEDIVKKIHDQGKSVYIWTVNDPAQVKRLIDLHVDCIITDNPTAIKAAMNSTVTQ